jgi:TolA-binding protein
MLYDIVPPLVFFGALGGIVVILSRIVKRMRRAELSVSIDAAAREDVSTAAVTLQPPQSRIRLMGSRSRLLAANLKKTKSELAVGSKTVGRHLRPTKWFRGIFAIFAWPVRAVRARRQGRIVLEQGPVTEETGAAVSPSPQEPPAPATPVVPTMVRLPQASAHSKIRLRKVETKATAQEVQEKKQQEAEEHFGAQKVFHPSFFKKTPKVSELEQARVALESANYEQAEEILVPYIFKHTKDTAAYMLLGQVAMSREAWAEAMEIFEQVIKQDPQHPGGYAQFGIAAYRAGKITKALQALQRARDVEPGNQEVLQQLLIIAQRMDNRALQHSIEEEMETLETPANINA